MLMSLILSIFLFILAKDSNSGLRSSTLNPQSSSNTITNVPIYVDINSEEYSVTGLPDSVALRLEGPSSLILSTSSNGSYKVTTPNLTELGEGKHTISLSVSGLPTGVTGIVSPESVEITVKAADSILNQVEKVVAKVTIPEGTKSDYTTTAQLQALDATGKPVAVKIEPERVQVRVPISSSSKTVPLVFTTTGGTSRYSYSLNSTTKQVTILGAQSILNQITAIPVVVDVSNVTQTTKKTVTLTLPSGVNSITPEAVEVTITVVDHGILDSRETTKESETTQEHTTQAR